MKSRVVIMISGRGSNMLALIKATYEDDFPAEIVGVLSDRADAGGIKRAQNLGVPTFVCERSHYASKAAHEAAQLALLAKIAPDIICLAGYMRLMGKTLIDAYQGRMLNIHPSLLPLFPGLDTHQRALQAGVKITGCSVHLVTPVMDGGPILAQAGVPVKATDNKESLAARVLAAEHQLYPEALRRFILNRQGRATPQQQRVHNEEDIVLFSY